jgi:hypothetical protein
MRRVYVPLIFELVTLPARAQTADAGVVPSDPALVEAQERECHQHIMRAQAFEARASLELETAAREKRPEVKRRMIDDAGRLSTLAQKERDLAGSLNPSAK